LRDLLAKGGRSHSGLADGETGRNSRANADILGCEKIGCARAVVHFRKVMKRLKQEQRELRTVLGYNRKNR
jgi:hypothetical protein